MSQKVDETLNEVFRLYRTHGDTDYIGEYVSKQAHSIQCGMLAEQEGFPTEIVLGAFLHDIGHLVGHDRCMEPMITDGINFGAKDHDIVGEKFLKDLGFPAAVTDFVRGHVNAKRYLVFKDKDYYEKLSSASKKTLVHQGGPMTATEAETFEKSDQFKAILKMRTWDEQAKDPNKIMEPLEKYEDMCRKYLHSLDK